MKFSSAALLLLGAIGAEAVKTIAVPPSDGDRDNGYRSIPEPEGFTLERLSLEGKNGVKLTQPLLHGTTTHDEASLERVIIAFTGKLRNCWTYAVMIKNPKFIADAKGITKGGMNIIIPCFLNEVDRDAGAAQPDDLTFSQTGWSYGARAETPEAATDISSFDIVDKIMDKYLDKKAYPKLNSVVLAGHSMGAQTVQRFAAIAKSRDEEDRIHYSFGNPGSILWLTKDRPVPDLETECPDFDEYKYGLSDGFPAYELGNIHKLGREGIIDRYFTRQVHGLWGTADHGAGDTRCEAKTQGPDHLGRGQNYDKMVKGLLGGSLGGSNHTIDYIEGVSHEGSKMFSSDAGLDVLFTV